MMFPNDPRREYSSPNDQRHYLLPDSGDPLLVLRRQYHWIIEQFGTLEIATIALASMIDLLPELQPPSTRHRALVSRLFPPPETPRSGSPTRGRRRDVPSRSVARGSPAQG